MRTNLANANLWETNLQGADLKHSKFDENTVLPDSERDHETQDYTDKWTPDTDMTRYTDPDHPNFWQHPRWAKGNDPASE